MKVERRKRNVPVAAVEMMKQQSHHWMQMMKKEEGQEEEEEVQESEKGSGNGYDRALRDVILHALSYAMPW